MRRKIPKSNNQEVDVISVPWFPQQEYSYYCFPYSLWMVLQYYKNVYNNKLIKQNIPDLDVETIAKICKTNKYNGTRINDQLITELNKQIPALKFELITSSNFEQIKRVLDKNCPSIIIYDCGYFIYNIPSTMGHAGVVIGSDEDSLYLNNPWLGAEIEVNKTKFHDAWEIEYNQVLLIQPNLQTQLEKDKFE